MKRILKASVGLVVLAVIVVIVRQQAEIGRLEGERERLLRRCRLLGSQSQAAPGRGAGAPGGRYTRWAASAGSRIEAILKQVESDVSPGGGFETAPLPRIGAAKMEVLAVLREAETPEGDLSLAGE